MSKEKKEKKREKKEKKKQHHKDDDGRDKKKQHKDKKKKKHKKEKKHSKKTNDNDNIKVLEMQLTEDDYFKKNVEFRVWLKIKQMSFENLTSDESRDLFTKFIEVYNKGSLPEYFYNGNIPQELREVSVKTNHKWNIAIDSETKAKLTETVDNVYNSNYLQQQQQQSRSSNYQHHHHQQSHNNNNNNNYNNNNNNNNNRNRNSNNRIIEKLVEEKPVGREAMIDKRKTVGDKIHSASREKEEAGLGSYDEKYLMGGDDGEDLQRLKRLRTEREQRKQESNNKRLQELQAKETDRMQSFLQSVGVNFPVGQGGGKIVIPPRE